MRSVVAHHRVRETERARHVRHATAETRDEQLFASSATERAAGGPVGDLSYDDKFLELMRIVIHHVADEETTLLPMAERLLGADRLSELGARMTRRRVELIKPHAGEFVVTAARSFPVGAAAGAALLAAGAIALGVAMGPRRRKGVRHYLRSWH